MDIKDIRSFEGTGDAFIELNHEELFQHKVPTGFTYIPSELLKWYPDTEQWGFRQQDIRYEPEELIHIHEPDIRMKSSKWGMCKIDKIGLAISIMFLGMKYNKTIMENDGIDPRAVLSFDKDVTDDTFEKELDRLQEYAQERKRGGTLAVKGATFQSSSITNSDMDFLSLMNMCRDMILTAYGVQPGKAGIRETASLGSGTGESQDKDFKDMMSAKSKLIEGAFNKVLGHNGFEELFQFNEMDIEDKLKRTQIETNKLSAGILTVNEVRTSYGLEPVAWGDIPQSMQQNMELSDVENDMMTFEKRYKNNILKAGVLSEWSDVSDWGKRS